MNLKQTSRESILQKYNLFLFPPGNINNQDDWDLLTFEQWKPRYEKDTTRISMFFFALHDVLLEVFVLGCFLVGFFGCFFFLVFTAEPDLEALFVISCSNRM